MYQNYNLNFLNTAAKHTHLVNFHLGWNLDDWDLWNGLGHVEVMPYVMSSVAAVANLSKPEVTIANKDHTERIIISDHKTKIAREASNLHRPLPLQLHPTRRLLPLRLNTTLVPWVLGMMAPAPLPVFFGHCSGNKAGKPQAAGEQQKKI
jgi:hypothetical protein